MDHHTIVNTVRIPRRRRTTHDPSTAQRLRKKTIDCLAKIKRPFLALKGRISENQGFHINGTACSRRKPDKMMDVEVAVVDAVHLEGRESEVASMAAVSRVSLDPSRSNIPTELRLKIWRMSWEPRTVEVHHFFTGREIDRPVPFAAHSFRSTAPIPVSLRVCTESRIETLRHYSLAFALERRQPEVYFNFDLDSLYVREADMLCKTSVAMTFPPKDLRRLQRLAIPDRYIQHLIGERRRPLLHLDNRPLSRILLECSSRFYPCKMLDLWRSLKEIEVVIDDDRRQRDDRLNSWAMEGAFVCAHCVLAQFEESLDAWPESPKVAMVARTRRGTCLAINPPPPQAKPIVKRDGFVMFTPCCRLRPTELLTALRQIDDASNKTKRLRVARALGINIQKVPRSAPCRCRLENYILSEGLSMWTSRWVFNRTDVGELGQLCKKWLHYLPYTHYR